LLSFQPVIAE